MTAKEMFKNLGYRYIETLISILYINDSDDEYKTVEFYFSGLTIEILEADNHDDSFKIDLELFDAIEQQIKELRYVEWQQKKNMNMQ